MYDTMRGKRYIALASRKYDPLATTNKKGNWKSSSRTSSRNLGQKDVTENSNFLYDKNRKMQTGVSRDGGSVGACSTWVRGGVSGLNDMTQIILVLGS